MLRSSSDFSTSTFLFLRLRSSSPHSPSGSPRHLDVHRAARLFSVRPSRDWVPHADNMGRRIWCSGSKLTTEDDFDSMLNHGMPKQPFVWCCFPLDRVGCGVIGMAGMT
ncbi:unnamed protein product [Prorocentrum cordatum]|uniref:Uncharacterized protein n=1 Tax=Prorocentrum cordatum TaxID=2364126 RepID=A0ABN9VCY8_9DINO|nr:unnamed protein product [Polarella glacialis]